MEEDHKAVCTDKDDTKESFFYTIGSKHFWSRVENSFLQGFCLKIYEKKKKELVSWQSQTLWFEEKNNYFQSDIFFKLKLYSAFWFDISLEIDEIVSSEFNEPWNITNIFSTTSGGR